MRKWTDERNLGSEFTLHTQCKAIIVRGRVEGKSFQMTADVPTLN